MQTAGICLAWKPEKRCGADILYSNCWISWIQAINLVLLCYKALEAHRGK